MDLVNGRNTGSLAAARLFIDRPSGREILALEDGFNFQGVIYHPLKFDLPVAWHSACPHCQRGHSKLHVHLKREIQMLSSRRLTLTSSKGTKAKASRDAVSEEYRIPTYNEPYLLIAKPGPTGWIAKISRPDKEAVLDVICQPNRKAIFQGNLRDFQSKILHRCLTTLFSAKQPSVREIRAILTPLLRQQQSEGRIVQGRLPCRKIDWAAILATE